MFKDVIMRFPKIKKILSVILIASVVFPAAGCSKILANIAARDASEYLNDALESFYNDPVNGLEDYDSEFAVPDLLEESLNFAVDRVGDSSYELGEASVNKDRTTIKIPVTFSNVLVVEDVPMGTAEEVADYLDDCDTDDFEITFVLKSKKNGWVIEDMSELNDIFFTPYESLIYIDDNGMPTSYYAPFFEECVVDSLWYDPIMARPLDSNHCAGNPEAMLNYVYFNRPIYMTFTANLIKNGDVVQSVEVTVDGRTTARCEFWGQSYTNGSYTMELVFEDGTAVTSAPIQVG